MKYNCPNCGAVVEYDLHKCPYCGTSYFDMSCIDFEEGTPFYLKFKINMNGLPVYITQLVVPETGEITMSQDVCTARSQNGVPICSATTSQQLTTNIKFNAVKMPNNHLMDIEHTNYRICK